MKKLFFASLLIVVSSSAWATATRLRTSCTMDPSGNVQGTNVDQIVEIASVSKILTAQWAVKVMTAHGRFSTKMYITPTSAGKADIHIEGGTDPLFSKYRLQLLVEGLNRIGINKIGNLTFDENFYFREVIRSGAPIMNNPAGTILSRETLVPELRRAVTTINAGFPAAAIQNATGVGIANSVAITVDDISFKAKADFHPGANTVSYTSQSVELHRILKEMNRTSNNYMANLVFTSLGGANAYRAYLQSEFHMGDAQVMMGNGSGYPILVNGVKFYNKATCRALVTVIRGLRESLQSQDMRIADVMAVAGRDAAGEPSTVSRIYDNEITDDSLIAKTGTADPSVSLAGVASTAQGAIYFGVVVADGHPGMASSGRVIIQQQLRQIFQRFGGSSDINYTGTPLFPIDHAGLLVQNQAAPLQ